MTEIDAAVSDPRFFPYCGWADSDKPAIQQVRSEFIEFVSVLRGGGHNRSCLQLGLGHTGGAHRAFLCVFDKVCSVDINPDVVASYRRKFPRDDVILGDSCSPETLVEVARRAPFDLIFIDADHRYEAVRRDYDLYSGFVAPDGVIAFYDAIFSNRGPEVEVWRWVQELPDAHVIGTELGIAYVLR